VTDATAQKKFISPACRQGSKWISARSLIIFALLAILACGCASEKSRTSPTQFTADNSLTLPINVSERVEPSANGPIIGYVNVTGAVRAPGRYSLTNGMTVADVIMAAGGPNDYVIHLTHLDGTLAIISYPATVFYTDGLRNGDRLAVRRIFPKSEPSVSK
jgi:hypothetical protein